MFKKSLLLSLVALLGMGLSGCPQLQPPFDATGSYAGTFSLGAGETVLAENCDITLALTQNVNAAPFENTRVSGTVNLSLACVVTGGQKDAVQDLLDGVLGQLLGVEPIDVEGVLLPNGTLTLSTEGLLDECTGEDCEKLLLIGQGVDTDDDGKMDKYSGTIGGLVQVSGNLVPLLGNFTSDVAE